MPDYVERLRLAVGDLARRSALKTGAAVALTVAAGFLIAALWSWLATGLGWGAALASLAVGGGFVLIGAILMMFARHPRHPMPQSEDLRREVEARVTLAADAAVGRAKSGAMRMVGLAGRKMTSAKDEATYRAEKMASDAGRRAAQFMRDGARDIGLDEQDLRAARARARRAADSNLGSMTKLIGAFAFGVALASRLRSGGGTNPDQTDEDDGLS